MKVRTVFNLVNGNTIMTDGKKGTREEAEKELAETVLPKLNNITYFNVICNGRVHTILKNAVTDLFIEEIPEATF